TPCTLQRSSSPSMNTPVAVPRRTKLSTSSQNAVVSPSLRRRSPSRACTARSSTSEANAVACAAAGSLLIDHLEDRVERLAHALQLLAGAQQQLVDPDEPQVASPPQIAQAAAGIRLRRDGGVELARRALDVRDPVRRRRAAQQLV